MPTKEITVDMGELGRLEAEKWTVVVNMAGWNGFRIRLRIATVLVWLACWISGMSYEEDNHVISLKNARIE